MTAETELRAVPRVLVGTPEQVRNVLTNAHRAGRLVNVAPARRVGPNRVRVDLVLMEPAAIARPAESVFKPRSVPVRYKVAGAAVTAALAALAAVGALIAALIEWVMTHAALVVGAALVLAVLALVLARLSRGHACSGLHCGGCGR